MICKNIKYILILFLVILSAKAMSQRDTTITQEVEVFKAFKPTISDANKINEMPKMEESAPQKPTFSYSIFSQPIYNAFSVNPLKAATIAQKPREDNGFGLVRAGVGNYNRPYGEIFFNSQNTKNTMFGIHARHLSSHGKINLEGGDRVKSPFAENEGEIFVKHMVKNSILSVNLDFNRNGFNYYGYPADSIPAPLKMENQNINYQGKSQAFTKGGLNINLTSQTAGSKDFTFDFNFLYQYFATKTSQTEHFGEFTANLKKPFNFGTGLLEAAAVYTETDNIFNSKLNAIGQKQYTWLIAKPAVYFGKDVANIRIGFNSWFVVDNDAKAVVKIAPNVRANLSPVKEIINIFAGVDGNYINNHYSKIAYENPFVNPEHEVKNNFEKLHFYGGFDGKLAAKTNFKISADYSMINDQPMYYLYQYVYPSADNEINSPDPSITDNDFKILYDDLDLLKFNLEIFHVSSDKLNLLLSGNYYVYKPGTQTQAWNMPDWDGKISLGYKVTDRLSVETDLFLIGQRKALIVEKNGYNDISYPAFETLVGLPSVSLKSYNLDTVFDLNFGANYKISQKFSVFANLNNLGFRKYQKWFGYPVQSFNFLGGLSYAF